jgi:hypothetical protein
VFFLEDFLLAPPDEVAGPKMFIASPRDFLMGSLASCSHELGNLWVLFDRVVISSASTDRTILLLAGLNATTLKL